MTCAHTNVEVTEAILKRDGSIRAFDAVYTLTCPFDGDVRRNTRLAATIHTLRHERGMTIETVQPAAVPGSRQRPLADYVLAPMSAPGRLTANGHHDAAAEGWACAKCGGRPRTVPVNAFGRYAHAACDNCGPRAVFKQA